MPYTEAERKIRTRMKWISTAVILFLGVYILVANGGLLKTSRNTRSGLCMSGAGVEERRALVNGLQALKKNLVRETIVTGHVIITVL